MNLFFVRVFRQVIQNELVLKYVELFFRNLEIFEFFLNNFKLLFFNLAFNFIGRILFDTMLLFKPFSEFIFLNSLVGLAD